MEEVSLATEPRRDDETRFALTRRTVLLGTGAAMASTPFVGADEAEARFRPDSEIYGPGVDVLSAIIGRVYSERTMYVIGRAPGRKGLLAIPVGLVPRAVVLREGERSLTAFSRADEVLMGGRWQPNGFAAAIVEQSYRLVEGTVKKRGRHRLVTTGGVVRFDSLTRAVSDGEPPHDRDSFRAVPLKKIREGDRIWAVGRREGPTGDLIATKIGTHRRTYAEPFRGGG
jgi:hypothetical protein